MGKKEWWKIEIPLMYIKPICMAAVMIGIVFVVSGLWIAGLCMLLGAYILEKSRYRCPHCGKKLDMKHPLMKGAVCPACRKDLRSRG